MTNYFYYTVLVVYTDGSRELVNGKMDQISRYLPYMKTPMDDLPDVKETIKDLRQEINDMVDQKVKYVLDSIFPIPDILNKNEVEAFDLLKEANLTPVLEIEYPESTPKNGIVQAYSRNKENFKKVDVRIIHKVPEIEDLKIEDAFAKLNEAGFAVKSIIYKIGTIGINGTVLRYSRSSDNELSIDLEVNTIIPETIGMPSEEAIRLLEDEGYDVIVQKQVTKIHIGDVVNWESAGEKTIRLYVGKSETDIAKHVNVKWTNLQDSVKDTYTATAEYDNRRRELTIRLSYTIGAKLKHQISGISLKETSWESPNVYCMNMEPNIPGNTNITVSAKGSDQKLPTKLSFVLETQYGLTKKKDPVDLEFEFEW